ncbi:hypothetical protein MACH26_14620 [Planctobacterium marinum]|uniref:Phospholipid/glycerol acyltransferase domain-containing protein n=2 Tax=Planctobacterium marinum TaxID=1631968 RepID=A0AA48KNV3_9ALTE|nr:hypothetical protein MACH26_14620 [Planctobacterium marinum]
MQEVKLLVLLNHTSLFEPLFIRFAPWRLIWLLAYKLVIPGADITMRRPMAGRILKALMPGCIPITRKNDHSWIHFLSQVNEQKITAILPEGRMKRRNGLDKFGKPMSVRGGVADILECLDEGKILFVYSGGLHHIQAPGDKWPNLFKTLRANMELVNIKDYKRQFSVKTDDLMARHNAFKIRVIEDMNRRLSECVPQS